MSDESVRPNRIGDTWNESRRLRDELTGRWVTRLTTRGIINQTPTYHTNSGFTADGRYLVFASVRGGVTWIIRADVTTGQLEAIWRAPGVGDRNYVHRGMALDGTTERTSPRYRAPALDGGGVCGNRVCVAPRSALAIFTCQRAIHTVDIGTCERRVLLADCGQDWIFGAPCVSPDERHVVIALNSAHPQILAGEKVTRGYTSYPDHRLRIIRVPIDGSQRVDALYEHQPAQSAHCAFCPTDGELLYFDLDRPPRYWGGGDGKTPRAWILNLETRQAKSLRPETDPLFETHTAWLWDGSALCYHGGRSGQGEATGVIRPSGELLWERSWPEARYYGHNTPDARRPALIIDGFFSRDLLHWLHYDEPARREPKLKPICVHGTEWASVPGQYSHPHPLTDASGRWISFTTAQRGRSDVCVVEIE